MDQARARRRQTVAVLLIAGSSLAVGVVLYAWVHDLYDDARAHLTGETPTPPPAPEETAALQTLARAARAGEADKAPAPIPEFLSRLGARRFDEAYALLSASWRDTLPVARFQFVLEGRPLMAGATFRFETREDRGAEGLVLKGFLTTTAGPRAARFRLRDEEGSPRIADVWLDGVSVLPRPVR